MQSLRIPENMLRHRMTRILFYALLIFYAWSWFSTGSAREQKIQDGLDGKVFTPVKAPFRSAVASEQGSSPRPLSPMSIGFLPSICSLPSNLYPLTSSSNVTRSLDISANKLNRTPILPVVS